MARITRSFVRLESLARIVNNPQDWRPAQNLGISGVRVMLSDSWKAKFSASFS
jgi:hypothetical protein